MKSAQFLQSIPLDQFWSGEDGFSDLSANRLAGAAGTAVFGQWGGAVAAPDGDTPQSVDSVPGDATTTATLAPGGYVEGAIDTSGDHDWFQITLVAGQTYTFSTIFSVGIGDTVLTLRNAAGTQLVQNDDANSANNYNRSEITFTATSSGTYYLDVSGFSSATGAYYLSASQPTADSIAASTATTGTITIGGSVNGTLENTGDHDWYAVQLVAGQSYEFTTLSTGGANDPDTALILRSSTGQLLAYNDDANGTYSRIRFTATTTGTYYIDVHGWAESQSGAYRLQAAEATAIPVFTNDQIATQLTNTYWGGTNRHFNVLPGGTITVNITGLTAAGANLAREALNLWSDVLGITFTEVGSGGQITFDDDQDGAFANSVRTGSIITSATVNVSTAWLTTSGTSLRSYSFQTYIHEIGHALGLGHAGPYNSTANYDQDATYQNDSWATTVMSYFDQQENTFFANLGFTRAYAVTPMAADILAVASLYGGGSTTTRTGDTTYGFNNNTGRDIYTAQVGQTSVAMTIFDNGGNDTLDFSGFSSNQLLDLRQEAFSNIGGATGNLTIARGTVIENAIGGNGADMLIGNSSDNRLNGGSGADRLYGLTGNDVYVVDQQADLVFESPGEGNDTVESSASFYLYANIENLILTGSANNYGVGNELDNAITGNTGENLLLGGLGIDTIHGGDARDSLFGEGGADQLFGDAGNDYIVGGIGNDMLDGGSGADELYGQEGDDTLWGGTTADADMLVGGDGNDILHGDSGLGEADRLYGNIGDDTFYVDTRGDLVFEQTGEGTDTVFANITGDGYYLYANIENLTLVGNTPFGVGNGLDNILTGSSAANWLLGGLGNDRINGMGGNDVLFGEGGNDTFVFQAGSGQDVIGDFVRGQDKIDLSAYGFSFAQIQAAMVQNGADGAINFGGGNFVVLNGVTMSLLTASDFILATPAEPASTKGGVTTTVMDPDKAVPVMEPMAPDVPLMADAMTVSGLDHDHGHWSVQPDGYWL